MRILESVVPSAKKVLRSIAHQGLVNLWDFELPLDTSISIGEYFFFEKYSCIVITTRVNGHCGEFRRISLSEMCGDALVNRDTLIRRNEAVAHQKAKA